MFDLKHAIDQAKFVTFLTGAGVSTLSGIPDYRSKTGLYAGQMQPEYALSHEHLVTDHEGFHRFVVDHMYYPDAKPNVVHRVMARITNQKGAVVTQNVDGLDRLAGTEHLVEFHGNLGNIYCQTCGHTTSVAQYLQSDRHEEDGGIYRPGIVLYGEPIAEPVVEAAIDAVSRADLVIVAGTSFQVYPFAGLIQYADPSAQLVTINREQITLPARAELVLGELDEIFGKLDAYA